MPGLTLSTAATSAAAEDAGVVVPMRDAAGAPLTYGADARPVTFTVAGTYSGLYRRAEREFTARITKQRTRHDELATALDRRGLVLAAACVTTWEGVFTDADETQPLPLSPANAEAVFAVAPWIFDQVWEAMTDHAGFSKRASSP